MKRKRIIAAIAVFFCSGGAAQKLGRTAENLLLNDSALVAAHVGISIYEPATGRWWYNYQGDKYFVPASNTKIPTCYAAMKYLGDSLPGLRYAATGTELKIYPTGDPTFLHPGFVRQPVFEFLRRWPQRITLHMDHWKDQPWGNGWSWNDYDEAYMAERSALPMYGNLVRFRQGPQALQAVPAYFSARLHSGTQNSERPSLRIERPLAENSFLLSGRPGEGAEVEKPFYTENGRIVYGLLADTLHKEVAVGTGAAGGMENQAVLYSQPTDSLLKPMMYRSDNFFAEQSLLMVSQAVLGEMDDARIIDTLLKTDLKDLPQKPRWADGSGLSRYNLFTPQDLVAILAKMEKEFGMARIRAVFPTGNTGTIANYYKADSGYIYAKTGTLSGVVAFSGFLYTRKNRLLLFSVLVNNHQSSASAIRRAIESFLTEIRRQY